MTSPLTAPVGLVPALLLATLLLVGGPVACSSGFEQPAYGPRSLRALLVGSAEVDLPGYAATTPAGERQSGTVTAIMYFTTGDGFRQVTVTLLATPDGTAARRASATAVRTAVDSMRTVDATSVRVGTDGRHIAGRTKGYGALQDSIFFVEGPVAVSVTLSSSTPDRPPDLVTGVARAQDAKLRKAA